MKDTEPPTRSRLDAIDCLRGLAVVLMALDHTRDFFSNQLHFEPTDLNKTDVPLFVTRWLTHFCAPIFVFLAGTGAWLYSHKNGTRAAAWFLISRGLWLIVVEHTLVHYGWFFNADLTVLYCGVLWALGCSMVLLAILIRFLPSPIVTLIALLMVLCHEWLSDSPAAWSILLHHPGSIDVGGVRLLVQYPIIPWVGVMVLGYGAGRIWTWEPSQRRRILMVLGTLAILAFVILRLLNGYGEPNPWKSQPTFAMTICSFLNCSKYPPSLCYLLMTLGPGLLLLAAFDRPAGRGTGILVTFGRVPLFFYILQWPVIHGMAVLNSWLRDGTIPEWLFRNPDRWSIPEGYGYPLIYVWLIWLFVVFLTYWPCAWFARVKSKRRDWWLSYL